MARPKKPTDELKDQRVPIMMSEDELKAVDDWRFENRIGSRGDAIRRLCRIGIFATVGAPKTAALTAKMVKLFERVFVETMDDDQSAEAEHKILKEFFNDTGSLHLETAMEAAKLYAMIEALASGKNFDDAVRAAKDAETSYNLAWETTEQS
jgi:hypothetical protein